MRIRNHLSEPVERNVVLLFMSVMFGLPLVAWIIGTVIIYADVIDSTAERVTRYLVLHPSLLTVLVVIAVIGIGLRGFRWIFKKK